MEPLALADNLSSQFDNTMYVLSDILSLTSFLYRCTSSQQTWPSNGKKAFNIHTLTVLSGCGLLYAAVFGVMSQTTRFPKKQVFGSEDTRRVVKAGHADLRLPCSHAGKCWVHVALRACPRKWCDLYRVESWVTMGCLFTTLSSCKRCSVVVEDAGKWHLWETFASSPVYLYTVNKEEEYVHKSSYVH